VKERLSNEVETTLNIVFHWVIADMMPIHTDYMRTCDLHSNVVRRIMEKLTLFRLKDKMMQVSRNL
jgi:hypothetical protein